MAQAEGKQECAFCLEATRKAYSYHGKSKVHHFCDDCAWPALKDGRDLKHTDHGGIKPHLVKPPTEDDDKPKKLLTDAFESDAPDEKAERDYDSWVIRDDDFDSQSGKWG